MNFIRILFILSKKIILTRGSGEPLPVHPCKYPPDYILEDSNLTAIAKISQISLRFCTMPKGQ
jgi:hypothetical protein